MTEPSFFTIILAMLLGGFIGLEREYQKGEKIEGKKHNDNILGVRSFTLLSFTGMLSGLFLKTAPVMAVGISMSALGLLLAHYVMGTKMTKDHGITTELAGIITFGIGSSISLQIVPIHLLIAITVLITLFLSRKSEIKALAKRIYEFEMDSYIAYAVVSLVVLPFLPNQSFSLWDIPIVKLLTETYHIPTAILQIEIINPYKLWFIVALISGLDVFGYILKKIVGTGKSVFISSLTGGFISSTATTQNLAMQSKKGGNIRSLVGGAIIANGTSFLQLFAIIAPINPIFLTHVTGSIITMFITSATIGLMLLFIVSKEKTQANSRQKKQSTVFALRPALKFAGLFLLIKYVSKIAISMFGDNGLYFSSAIAAITGVDAITITISELAGSKISYETALYAFLTANSINLLTKSLYAYSSGSKTFAKLFFFIILIIILCGLLGNIYFFK